MFQGASPCPRSSHLTAKPRRSSARAVRASESPGFLTSALNPFAVAPALGPAAFR